MKIIPGLSAPKAPASEAAVSRAGAPSPRAAAPAAQEAALQSAVLSPARAALESLPEVDHSRVAELRDALARGDLPFDATKLAALIHSYHWSGK